MLDWLINRLFYKYITSTRIAQAEASEKAGRYIEAIDTYLKLRDIVKDQQEKDKYLLYAVHISLNAKDYAIAYDITEPKMIEESEDPGFRMYISSINKKTRKILAYEKIGQQIFY